MKNSRVIKFDEMTDALYEVLNTADGVSGPTRTYLETEEMNKRFHGFCDKYSVGHNNDIFDELVELVFSYHREAFKMGIKTALSFIAQSDLTGATEEKEGTDHEQSKI